MNNMKNTVTDFSEEVTFLGSRLNDMLRTLSKDYIEKLNIQNLVALQDLIKKDIESIKLIESSLVKLYEYLRKGKVPELMLEEDIQAMSVKGVGRVSLIGDIYASIKNNKKSEVFEWLDDNGHGALIQKTVHTATLKKLLKDKIKGGEKVPDELFNVTPYTYSKIVSERKTINK